jgi:hypothetical protein
MNAMKAPIKKERGTEAARERQRARTIAASKGIKAGELLRVIAVFPDVQGVVGTIEMDPPFDAPDAMIPIGSSVIAVEDEAYAGARGATGRMLVRVLAPEGIVWVDSRDVERLKEE